MSEGRRNPTEESRIYREGVLAALRGTGWSAEVERAARVAMIHLREHREALAPGFARAAGTTAKSLIFTLVPLLLADALWHRGLWWAALPLVLLSGMTLYGAIAIVHDLAHASFLAPKRLNGIVGYLVAPLLFMQFGGFRRSHLDHHRHSQSTADPKRFGATHSDESNAPGYRTLDHSVSFLKGPVRLGAAVSALPIRIRQFLYLCVAPIFIGPAVILVGGEFSLLKRDWRLAESWLATLQSALFAGLLCAWSPRFFALFIIALLIGYGFIFFVFAAHLSPNQVYWTSDRRAVAADALNVSDVRCGAVLRWLGNGFSDYHSTHHLSPAIPCYRLGDAADLVAAELAPFRAPALDFVDPEACALLYDNYFRAIVQTNAEAWDYTVVGALRNLETSRAQG